LHDSRLAFNSNIISKSIFSVLLNWTSVLVVISLVINPPLRTSPRPCLQRILQAGMFASQCNAMISFWNTRVYLFAAIGLGFDYLFLPSYAFTIAMACLLVADRHVGWFATIGA
jgi:hypothetical protein